MMPFSLIGAEHYCRSFVAKPGHAEKSIEEFRQQQLSPPSPIDEGTSLYEDYRACALRDAERSLFLAASHYRRCLDLMLESSCAWAQVTLYYGAWFAAQAILKMFGCAVLRNHVIHVSRSMPGSQQLRVQRAGAGPNHYHFSLTTSHARFWEAFYNMTPKIINFADASFSTALQPVSSSKTWLIDERNKVNYDTLQSIGVAASFQSTFLEGDFPNSLPGTLNTQYRIAEGLLAVGCSFATRFGLDTDALISLSSPGSFAQKVTSLIDVSASPTLVSQTMQRTLFPN